MFQAPNTKVQSSQALDIKLQINFNLNTISCINTDTYPNMNLTREFEANKCKRLMNHESA